MALSTFASWVYQRFFATLSRALVSDVVIARVVLWFLFVPVDVFWYQLVGIVMKLIQVEFTLSQLGIGCGTRKAYKNAQSG